MRAVPVGSMSIDPNLARMEGNLGMPKRPPKPKPPSGTEKKNQLDLFLDWAVEGARRAVATAAAATDTATKHLEELVARFDRRSAKLCAILVGLLAACSYKASYSLTTVIVAATALLSALLTAVPLAASHMPRHASRILRASNYLATSLLIVGVSSFVAEMLTSWSPSTSPPGPNASQHSNFPKAEVPPTSSARDEKLLVEEAQKDAAARSEKEAARVADCLAKENATDAARRTYKWSEHEFARCRREYNGAFTLNSLDAYCSKQRSRLDAAARALDSAVANMCSSTGNTKKPR
jgi:hypothetical protein